MSKPKVNEPRPLTPAEIEVMIAKNMTAREQGYQKLGLRPAAKIPDISEIEKVFEVLQVLKRSGYLAVWDEGGSIIAAAAMTPYELRQYRDEGGDVSGCQQL